MLKLVEIINTMPKRVCRVVLFAESKDDISQKALDEFQDKAEFTVAGGSFIYDSNKEISVTARDGMLFGDSNTDLKYWLTHTEFTSPGLKTISLEDMSELSPEEQKTAIQNMVDAFSRTPIMNEYVYATEEVIQKFNNGDFSNYVWNEETQEGESVPATEEDNVPGYYLVSDNRYYSCEVSEVIDGGVTMYKNFNYGITEGWRIENEAPDNTPIKFGDLIHPTWGPLPMFWVMGGKSK